MIEERVRVVRSSGDWAEVEAADGSGCSGCGSGCAIGALTRFFGSRRRALEVRNPIGARDGDWVVVGLDERVLVRSSLLAYLMPLLALLAGAILGQQLGGEALALLLGVAALGIALGGAHRLAARFANRPGWQPAILRHTEAPQVRVQMPS